MSALAAPALKYAPQEQQLIDVLRRKDRPLKLHNYVAAARQFRDRAVYCHGFPVWLCIDPTNACMLHCPMCPNGAGLITRPRGMMPFERFQKILNVLGPYVLHVDLQNWGEPLLNPAIYQMINYAKSFSPYLTLCSNMQVCSEEGAEQLVVSGLDRLIVSIDGASAQTYSQYRRGGDFSAALAHVRQVVEKKRALGSASPRIIWQFLVFRHNEHELELATQLGKDIGVDEVTFTAPFFPTNNPNYFDWIPRDPRYNRYGKDEAPAPVSFPACVWPWQGITVNWDGAVAPCCGAYRQEDDFGNFFSQDDFMRLWNNRRYRAARAYLANRVTDPAAPPTPCTACAHVGKADFTLSQYWLE